jgi:hypothetical protein
VDMVWEDLKPSDILTGQIVRQRRHRGARRWAARPMPSCT